MNEDPCQIRNASLEDSSDIAELSTQLGYPAIGDKIKKHLAPILNSADHVVYVAQLPSGPVIAWIHAYRGLSVESGAYAEIAGFIVSEQFRGNGVGKQLLSAVEHWTRQMQLSRLRVRSQIHREGAMQFYTNMGFTLTKQQRVFDKSIEDDHRKY